MGILFPLCSCVFAQSGSDAGTAVITLDVRFDWGDGSGYQILLDADHNAYDSLIPDYSTNLLSEGEAGSLYAAFEYKMPETASGSLTEGFFTGAGRWSMEVPAGVYDYVVANPTPGSGIWVANGMDGRGNDFHFEAGYEYIFRITRQLVNGNVRDFCERRVPAPIDLAVSAILSPLSGTGLDDNTAVVARISNEGLDTVSSFLLRYSIDGGSPVEEPVEQTLAPEETIEHTFAVRADFSELRSYNLQVEVAAEGDTVDGNNVLECVIDHVEPVPVPFRVDFNDTSDIGNFRILDANEDGMSWVRTTTIWPDADGNEMDPGSVYGKYLEIACPSSRPMDDWLMVFPPVYLNVLEGIGYTDRQLLEMARVFRVPFSRQLRGIYLPAVLPYFRSAVSLGLGLCWKSGAAAEVIGLPAGSIGEALYTAKVYFQTGDLFAWTAVIVAVSVVFERLFLRLVDALAGKAGG